MKVAVVVLAAGAATRMQSIKQLLPYKQLTLLENALNTANQSQAEMTICVLGANATHIQNSVDFNSVVVTVNENWADGLGSSIAHSIHFMEQQFPTVEAVLFTLADQPFVNSDYLNTIIEKAIDPAKIYASNYQDTLGVPVLFPKKYFDDLKHLTGEQGAKKLIQFNREAVIPISTPFSNLDIDTPEDYSQL